ncbi:MAG: zinc ribbon domain-containing protein [candidate division Zixibacteria bacterium]|nr:zinc ribbon domain-containing protein [candidate division Zixibacteria bacterium]
MPTYDYKCPGCGYRFENFRPMTDPDMDCPICGEKTERLISAGAGFLFRGSGFYITDYRSKDYKKKAEREKKAIMEKAS